ncbi:MAG: DUF4860 domain-containing protein [Oscillospiraceae bacterium]
MGLICLFAFCSLALALLGGRAYRQIQAGVEDSFGSTVAASHLRTKLSQNNAVGAVSLRDEGGVQVLAIATTTGEADYETRIYLHEGTLWERFVTADTPFSTVGGIQIAQLARCTFAISPDGLFTSEIESSEGSVVRVAFALAEGGVL